MCLSRFFKKITGSPSWPHPEEPANPKQTVANINVGDIRAAWEIDWGVPLENWDLWDKVIIITAYDAWSPELLAKFPKIKDGAVAFTYNDAFSIPPSEHMCILAPYITPGTIGYEMAHHSWDFLTDPQKTEYQETFNRLKDTDSLLVKLFKQYPHELVADTDVDIRIAGHAQIYRCLGEKMLAPLIKFYPRLF